MRKYILEGKIAVPTDDLIAWGRCFEGASRIVKQEDVGDAHVSTVFLGIDHRHRDGPPLLFETMVFGGPLDGEQERCSTWEQAEAQHAATVERVKEQIQ